MLEFWKLLGPPDRFWSIEKGVIYFLIEKVQQRVSSWKSLFLSPAGRLALINSILATLSNYVLSVFKIPVSVSKRINSILAQFWWSGSRKGKAIHWCSKTFLSLPKGKGGLGIRNLSCLNQALLGKQAWKILTNTQSFFSSFFKAKYHFDVKDLHSTILKPTTNSSWGWKGILWGAVLLKDDVAWKVGMGNTINIWEDKWVDGMTPEPKGTDIGEERLEAGTKVKELIANNGDWNVPIISRLMEEVWVNRVLAIPLSRDSRDDTMFWKNDKSGMYTVKSGYALALDRLLQDCGSRKDNSRIEAHCLTFIKKKLWHLPGPRKWSVLLWKILTDSLPLGKEFLRRGLLCHQYCVICDSHNEVESTEHLFRDCPMASRLWAGSSLGIRSHIGRESSIKRWIVNWLVLLANKDDSQWATLSFMATIWALWWYRNDMVFRNTVPSLTKIINVYNEALGTAWLSMKKQVKDNGNRGREESEVTQVRFFTPIDLIGKPASCNTFNIRVDAAWTKDYRASYGWVLIDPRGQVIHQNSGSFWSETPTQAEAVAVWKALKWAKDNKILHVSIFSDCLNVVLQVAGLSRVDHHLAIVLQNLSHLFPFFHCLSLSFLPRVLNRAAHNLAKAAKKL